MNKEEAAAQIGIIRVEDYSTSDIIEEYESRVFEINQFFLRRTIVPSLILSRITKLIKLEEALGTLLNTEVNALIYEEMPRFSPERILKSPANILELLRNFDFKRSQILLTLSNSLDVIQSLRSLKSLYSLQISFGILLNRFLGTSEEFAQSLECYTEEVKLVENVSTGELIKLALENNFSSPKFAKEYLRQQKIISGFSPSLLCP